MNDASLGVVFWQNVPVGQVGMEGRCVRRRELKN